MNTPASSSVAKLVAPTAFCAWPSTWATRCSPGWTPPKSPRAYRPTRQLHHATLVRAPNSSALVDVFMAQQLEVTAGVKQQLQADAQRLPGLSLLPGRFMVIHQAIGMPAARSLAALQRVHF